jgi:hypothetical protein
MTGRRRRCRGDVWDRDHPDGARVHDHRDHHRTTIAPLSTTKELMVLGGHSSPRAALIHQAATAKCLEQVAGPIDDIEAAGGIEPPFGALQALLLAL